VREDVVAAVELLGKLVLGVHEILETVLPKAHVLEAGPRLLVGLDPVRRAEGHHKHEEAGEGDDGAEDHAICKLGLVWLGD